MLTKRLYGTFGHLHETTEEKVSANTASSVLKNSDSKHLMLCIAMTYKVMIEYIEIAHKKLKS